VRRQGSSQRDMPNDACVAPMTEGWPEPMSHGYVNVLGFRMFYRICGSADARETVLCIHGGPGCTHDYLQPFADLIRHGYRVVFMDQLGCGLSERTTDTSLFTVEHNVEEVEGMREALHLGRVHIVGSSYGGGLVLAYALQHQRHLKSLTTVGGLASIPLTVREMWKLVDGMPKATRDTIYKYDKLREYDHPEYLRAVDQFYHQFVCRLPEWPPLVTYSFVEISKPVYNYMNGPNEFTITGTIRDWDISARLGEIHVPTLVTGGRYDEVSPACARQIADGIPGAIRIEFEKSSHTPFWEERAAYIEAVRGFLHSVT